MARGSNARGRRADRRATERLVAEGVGKAPGLAALKELPAVEPSLLPLLADAAEEAENVDEFAELLAEALADGGTGTFAIPADQNYRPCETETECCDVCWHFANGACTLFDNTPVDAAYTCDSFKMDSEPDADDEAAVVAGAGFELTELVIEPLTADAGDLPEGVTPPEVVESAPAGMRWTAVLCPEGRATDDGRIFAPGAITWRELPLTLMGMLKTAEGHDDAQVSGRIDKVWRDGDLIRASGIFDDGDWGSEIARLVGDRTLTGVSVDIAIKTMEIAYRSEVVDEDGVWIEQADTAAEEDDGEEGESGPSMIDLLFGDTEEEVVFVVREGVIGAATVCPFQAFADATIEIASSLVAAAQSEMVWTVTSQAGFVVTRSKARESAQEPIDGPPDAEADSGAALTASAAGIAPTAPPVEWFEDPALEELTALTIDDDGRLFGHVAPWGECHIGIPGVCTTAPTSHSDYAYFHLKEVVCDDGQRVSCGTITLDAPHAANTLGRAAAAAHYDDTGVATADVVVGEDDHGIWIAGALRGDVDELRARKLRGASLSGDWRDVNGNLELVAVLAVNVPGFPIPRTRAMVASAEGGPRVLSLVAAGIHDGTRSVPPLTPTAVAQLDVLRDIAEGSYDALAEESA